MGKMTPKQKLGLLLGGDILTLILVTVAGFATHGTAATAGGRMFTTLIPLALAWFLSGPFLGCYDLERASQPRQLWRPFWAMALAGPLAAWGRALMLGNAPILPVFVLVLMGVGAFSLLAWRIIFILIVRIR